MKRQSSSAPRYGYVLSSIILFSILGSHILCRAILAWKYPDGYAGEPAFEQIFLRIFNPFCLFVLQPAGALYLAHLFWRGSINQDGVATPLANGRVERLTWSDIEFAELTDEDGVIEFRHQGGHSKTRYAAYKDPDATLLYIADMISNREKHGSNFDERIEQLRGEQ